MQHIYALTENEVRMISGGEIGPDIHGTIWAMYGVVLGVAIRYVMDNYASTNTKQKVDYAVECALYYPYKLMQLQTVLFIIL